MPLFKENISFDSSRWREELLPRLEYFFKRALFPEILTKRVERGKLLYLHGGWIPYGQYSCTVSGLKLRFNRAQWHVTLYFVVNSKGSQTTSRLCFYSFCILNVWLMCTFQQRKFATRPSTYLLSLTKEKLDSGHSRGYERTK